jgi:hypothetical protein
MILPVRTRIQDLDDAASGKVPVTLGGTGAADAATARTNLGLGSSATHPASDFAPATALADLAAKAPLASPAFTGTPTAPTATAGANTTQIATTAFVMANAPAGGLAIGNAVSGGGANRVLYEDASGNLATSTSLRFDGTTLVVPTNMTGIGTIYRNILIDPGGGVVQAKNLRAFYTTPDVPVFRIDGFGPGVATVDIVQVLDASNGFTRLAIDKNYRLTWRDFSSTSIERDTAQVQSGWAVATDASRTGYLDLYAADWTGVNKRGLRVYSDGTRAHVTCPGDGLQSEKIGVASNASGNYSTVFGANSVAAGIGSSAIGFGAQATAINALAFGKGAQATATQAISFNGTARGIQSIAVGGSTSGDRAILFGAATSTHSSIVFGDGATDTADFQAVFGGTYLQIRDFYIGSGVVAASPVAATIHGTGGSGLNVAGASLSLAGGQGTGSGAGGPVSIQVAPAGSTGTPPNALVNALVADTAAGAVRLGVYGVPPVARAAAVATPTDLASCITAITAIRNAIKNFGITQ